MRAENIVISLFSAAATITIGAIIATPFVFVGRVMPYVWIDGRYMGGVSAAQLSGVLQAQASVRQEQRVTLVLRGKEVTRSLEELGINLDVEQSAARRAALWQLDEYKLRERLSSDFNDVLELPKDASLTQQSAAGEVVDTGQIREQLLSLTRESVGEGLGKLDLAVVPTPAQVQDAEVEGARQLANKLLREGFTLAMREKTFQIKPFTINRLLRFEAQADPKNPSNKILGVRFEEQEFEKYVTATISPEVHVEPEDARFAFTGEGLAITPITAAKTGQQVDMAATAANANRALAQGQAQAALAVATRQPRAGDLIDANQLGITTLLTTGESDFKGSPRNRIHNITVGTARYHGLLIPPNSEFSFDGVLGPVDGAHGFKPELVIKHNVTTPEFGGGLCQVSTTVFRAAVQAGLKITARRNHAYAVRYYGTPGFDATIYPPYTDLRFLNNTPGYILIQAKIDGTKLAFEFWGTPDGREVLVEGPVTFARQSNGAVKATLKQKVTRGDEVIIEETFYSNYRSPALFPHALHDQPAITTPNTTALPTSSPTPAPKASPKPSPSPTPEPAG